MSLLDRTPPEDGPLAKLKARQAEEDAAYEMALADLDRLSSFQVPMTEKSERAMEATQPLGQPSNLNLNL